MLYFMNNLHVKLKKIEINFGKFIFLISILMFELFTLILKISN